MILLILIGYIKCIINTQTFSVLAGPLDCSATACGAEKWIIKNTTAYAKYFSNAMCSGGTPLQNVPALACACPSLDLISPCTCATSLVYTLTADISCTGNAIPNDRMGTIISNIPATTAIGKLDLSGTGISQVPPGLIKFTAISELSLAANQITAVDNGALSLDSSSLRKLDLSGNAKLTTIGNSSLPRKC